MTAATTPLLLVDGHHLLYSAWFGFPARITSRNGADLTGVFGTLALLWKSHREHAPGHEVLVAFDGEHGSAARAEADPDYKANRADADHSPIASLPWVKAALDAIGVRWIEHDTAEGDDTIATLTTRALAEARAVRIMSGDRDLLQLLTDARVSVLNRGAPPERRIRTAADVEARFGVAPGQWPCFRALTGDPADNIPGVRGVGPATATRLLTGGLSLEGLLVSDRLVGVLGRRVTGHAASLRRWRDLIRLDHRVDLPDDLTAGRRLHTSRRPPRSWTPSHCGTWHR
ncbi:5'-3' exonuclease H3TH domain-containing protein [Embleya sp. NPDC056575]|uniref:5'-3' exonuclease n=1 Tax=unclassified Embleya TaxID=2699296 RepID=UPI0036771FA4